MKRPRLRVASVVLTVAVALLASGCSETVGFVDLKLESPPFDPPLICDKDPRRVARVKVTLRCGATTVAREFSIDQPAALSGVPLGRCEAEVEARNLHGRRVLYGSRSIQVDSGDNPLVTLQLVPERCDASCDQDADGLADADEQALGLDSGSTDTDLDGVDDGFELMHCCSDPLVNDGKGCKLGIQEVLPRIGAPGETVLLKISQLVENAEVQLGSSPFALFFTDPSTILLGSIGEGAVLGDVDVTADGQTTRWGSLYAVLRRRAELVVEIDRDAGAVGALVSRVIDVAASNDVLYLLGVSSGGGPAGVSLPIFLRYDQLSGAKQRVLVPINGVNPIAIAARDGRLAALAVGPTQTVLVSLLESQLGGAVPPKPTTRTIDAPAATALLLEPGGRYAQVLARGGLLRVDLDSSATSSPRPTPLPQQVPGPFPGSPATALYNCTGLAHRAATGDALGGYSYLACTATCGDPTTPAGPADCKTRPLLLRLGPLDKCLVGAATGAPAGCWQSFVTPGGGDSRALGSPVVDESARRVYLLSSTLGVLLAPFDVPPQVQPQLQAFLPLQIANKSTGAHPMVLDDQRRLLYLADGPQVQRLGLQGAVVDRPRAFAVGNAQQETAEMLALTGRGSLLAVLRSIGGQAPALLGVCVERCPTCPCLPPAPGP